MPKNEIKFLVVGYVVWRVALFLVSLLAPFFLAYEPSFPYAYEKLPNYELPQFLYSWAGFDGIHYLTIAEKGYIGTGLIQAFFPGYPLLMAVLNVFLDNSILSGLVLSTFFSAALWGSWYFFLKERYGKQVALVGQAVLFLFPTSFFFTAVYSESLFLLLILWVFILAQKRYWLAVMSLTALLTATRIVGILILPALLLEVMRTESWRDLVHKIRLWIEQPAISAHVIRSILLVCLGSVGLISYMSFLWLEFGDPLYFFHVQSEFGSGRQESLVSYPQVVWRYVKILVTYQPHDWKYFTYISEAVAAGAGLIIIAVSATKVRPSWWLFSMLAFFLPTLTGNFSSMPRYILVCFPIFIWIALKLQSNRWLLWPYLLVSTVLLILNTMLYIQGYWVA